MTSIIEGSEPAIAAESHIFAIPPSFADRFRTEEERIGPTAAIPENIPAGGDINFYIAPSSNAMVSLPDLSIELEVALKKRNTDNSWDRIQMTDTCAPVNNLIHSMFQSVQVSVANRLVSDCAIYYPYRAMFECLLSYTKDAMGTQLTSSGFYLDKAGSFDDAAGNTGEQARLTLFTKYEYIPLSGKLFSDIFMQDKPLITGVPLQIRFVLHKPEFYLRDWANPVTSEYRLFIRNPRIFVRRYVGVPEYMNAISKRLLTTTAKYPIERVLMRPIELPANIQSTVFNNIHIGQVPKVLFVAFATADAFNGTKKANPFNFQHFNLSQISVEVDGQSFPNRPYEPDYANGKYLDCYDGLLDTLGRRNSPFGALPFNRDEYAKGFCIYGFDLTPGGTGLGPLSLIRQGNLGIRVVFSEPLRQPTIMITLLTFDAVIEINNFRQLICDFTN
ncbi:uncharacterized protein F54H12.2-like [Paramacrobiotus metropolitanus]|uniref:uncharacterized protein F54H12.2-like n=1 Tax=Paramacrobiotus metropolitanus TaxID=2943436 RepID=UPI0024461F3B|nr:uncharacterized protein F54H12.2-like [Paramacrobiotus metropolitanus]